MPLSVGVIAYTHYRSDPRVRREAEALAMRGDQVVVWTLEEEGQPLESTENGVCVRRIKMPRYRGARSVSYLSSYGLFFGRVARAISSRSARMRFDVVHVHTMPDFMVFAALVPRLLGAKVVLDMHDLMPDLYAVKFGDSDGPGVRALRWVQALATRFADVVISVHANQYELLLKYGVPARKLAIVMNSPDPALFPRRSHAPEIGEADPVLLSYHGTILERYGIDLAVRAFAKAHAREPRLHFRILGGGDFSDAVHSLAKELGLEAPYFSFEGRHRPLSEIASCIRDAHIAVVPNRDDHEDSVLPTKLLEYISVGIPAIASRTRTVDRFFGPEQVELVEVGDIDGMADAMLKLAQNPSLRSQLVERAWAWEEEFGFEVNRAHLLGIFDRLRAQKNP